MAGHVYYIEHSSGAQRMAATLRSAKRQANELLHTKGGGRVEIERVKVLGKQVCRIDNERGGGGMHCTRIAPKRRK